VLGLAGGVYFGTNLAQADPDGVAIPNPCQPAHPFEADASTDELIGVINAFGFKTTGPLWTSDYHEVIFEIATTLNGISCTSFLDDLKANHGGELPNLKAWDKGNRFSGSYDGAVNLYFSNIRSQQTDSPGYASRLFIHEMTHAYTSNRASNPAYYQTFATLNRQLGPLTEYASSYSGDSRVSENFSEVVAYYVARCATDPYNGDRPYDEGFQSYYSFAKDTIFGGQEFGPALGQPMDCSQAVVNHEPVEAPAPVAAEAPADPDDLPTNATFD
jgi:hypothetical protein